MITAKEVSDLREDFRKTQMQTFINSNQKGFEILKSIIIEESVLSSFFEKDILLDHEYQDYLSTLDLPKRAPSSLNEFIYDLYYHKKLNLFNYYLRSLGYLVIFNRYTIARLFRKDIDALYLKIEWPYKGEKPSGI